MKIALTPKQVDDIALSLETLAGWQREQGKKPSSYVLWQAAGLSKELVSLNDCYSDEQTSMYLQVQRSHKNIRMGGVVAEWRQGGPQLTEAGEITNKLLMVVEAQRAAVAQGSELVLSESEAKGIQTRLSQAAAFEAEAVVRLLGFEGAITVSRELQSKGFSQMELQGKDSAKPAFEQLHKLIDIVGVLESARVSELTGATSESYTESYKRFLSSDLFSDAEKKIPKEFRINQPRSLLEVQRERNELVLSGRTSRGGRGAERERGGREW